MLKLNDKRPLRPTVQMWVFDSKLRWLIADESNRLNKRRKEAGVSPVKKYWLFLQGGYASANETIQHAAIRELEEEVGLKTAEIVSVSKKHYELDWITTNMLNAPHLPFRGADLHPILIYAPKPNEAHTIPHENQGVKWMEFEKALSLFTFPAQEKITRKIGTWALPLAQKYLEKRK